MSNFVECDKHWKYFVYNNQPLFNLEFVITSRLSTWRGEALSHAMMWSRHIRGGAWLSSERAWDVGSAPHFTLAHPTIDEYRVYYTFTRNCNDAPMHTSSSWLAILQGRFFVRHCPPCVSTFCLSDIISQTPPPQYWHTGTDQQMGWRHTRNWSTEGVKKYLK